MTGRTPSLDGLRGLAILLVLVAHTTPFHAGWVGVELFFVLSGYLITGILLRAKGGSGYFRAFYARRALRILPLYLLFLVFLWTVWPLTPAQHAWLDGNGWWYWLHLANVGQAYAGNPPGNMTTHLWTLAVEEQFYLVWPAVIWWLSSGQARCACIGLIILGMTLRWADPGAPWLNTLIRIDSIAVGAWIALADAETLKPRRVGLAAACCVGLTMMLEPTLLPSSDPRWAVWLQPVLAVAFGALLVTVVRRSPRWATWGWLGWVGRVSYCVYLVHVPVAILLRRQVGPHIGAIAFLFLVTVLSSGIAALSWWLWESRWLALKDRVPMPRAPRLVDAQEPAAIGRRVGARREDVAIG
jgi:peptidoglycan/LPS O-acetylase OafA/YrhL